MTGLHDLPLVAGLLLALAALLWAAASDIRHYLIPNRACLAAGAAYLTALAWMAPGTWLAGLAMGLIVLAIGAALFARGWLGGGDVKLAAVVAAWAGPRFGADLAFVTAMAGGVLALVMLSPLRAALPGAEAAEGGLKQPMPYGVPLAAGGAWVLALQFAAHH